MLCLLAVVQTNELSSTSGVAQIHSFSTALSDPAVLFWSLQLQFALVTTQSWL